MQARKTVTGKTKTVSPLKVVVMSATLDTNVFLAFFPGAASIHIPGRQYPVQILYTKEPQEVSEEHYAYNREMTKHSHPFCSRTLYKTNKRVFRITLTQLFVRCFKYMKKQTKETS